MADEFVNVPVPRPFVARVYEFLGTLYAEVPVAITPLVAGIAEGSNGSEPLQRILEEWTPKLIHRMVRESPPAMRNMLRLLAKRSGQWVHTEDLADSIEGKKDADWNTVAGALGAFGRRCRHRYKCKTLPFERRYDHDLGGKVLRMPEKIAEEILKALDERE